MLDLSVSLISRMCEVAMIVIVVIFSSAALWLGGFYAGTALWTRGTPQERVEDRRTAVICTLLPMILLLLTLVVYLVKVK